MSTEGGHDRGWVGGQVLNDGAGIAGRRRQRRSRHRVRSLLPCGLPLHHRPRCASPRLHLHLPLLQPRFPAVGASGSPDATLSRRGLRAGDSDIIKSMPQE